MSDGDRDYDADNEDEDYGDAYYEDDSDDLEAREVADWFRVSFDDDAISIEASPPDGEAWTADVKWPEIERIAYKVEDLLLSDGLYLFIKEQDNSVVIPIEASGGQELWGEIIDRQLFDAKLAIEAATAPEGSVLVWPPQEG